MLSEDEAVDEKPSKGVCLLDFGIKAKVFSNGHRLKCGVMCDEEGKVINIIFRCDIQPGNKVCWQEKTWSDAMYAKEEWCSDLNIMEKYESKDRNDSEDFNPSGKFCYRIFVISCSPMEFNAGGLLKLGRHITDILNEHPDNCKKNSVRLGVDENDYFYINVGDHKKWEDLVGPSCCLEIIKRVCGHNVDRDFYNRNQEFIHRYFRRNSLSVTVADAVGAPARQIGGGLNLNTAINVESKSDDSDSEKE